MHILVVGGGMGGTILANNLARRLSGELEQGSSKSQCYQLLISICINQVYFM
jgi:NADH dehydrogenase FAD-containing subunit